MLTPRDERRRYNRINDSKLFIVVCKQTNEPANMALIEILIGVGVIVGAIALIVGLDWIATDAVRELEDWIRSRLKKRKKSRR